MLCFSGADSSDGFSFKACPNVLVHVVVNFETLQYSQFTVHVFIGACRVSYHKNVRSKSISDMLFDLTIRILGEFPWQHT